MDAEVAPPKQPHWLRRWRWVTLAVALSLPYALATAALGDLFINPIGRPIEDLDSWGTIAWVCSAILLAGPAAIVPGPRRTLRIILGLILAVVWFVVGRYLLLGR